MKALKRLGECVLALVFLWAVGGFVAFRLRHPWATETECLVHWTDALTFQKVPYEEMRIRPFRVEDAGMIARKYSD
jgi:hypothetical protein